VLHQEEANQPVVIDNGTGILKAGFAGSDRPTSTFYSAVGRPKHQSSNMIRVYGGKLEGSEYVVGDRVMEHRGILKIDYPMEHGIVKNWEDMEKVWAHVYGKDCLGIKSEEHPVLLTEAPVNPLKNRERAAEVFFEAFNVPALYVAPQAVLSLYASGRSTGLVLDCGEGVSHVVPVYEGFALPHAVTRSNVAGRDVTGRLQLLLRRGGFSLQTSSEREIVRQIKEECCRVSFNPRGETASTIQEYRLPDGEVVAVGAEAHDAPEVLFQPNLMGSEEGGVHECLHRSLMRSDRDLRSVLYKHIVLAGGSTLFKGFGDRLLNELRKVAPGGTQIIISAPPQRQWSTWVGGSILAALNTFNVSLPPPSLHVRFPFVHTRCSRLCSPCG
jgi:centractin